MLANRQSKTTAPEKKKTNGMEQPRKLPGFTPGGICETTAEREEGQSAEGRREGEPGCGPQGKGRPQRGSPGRGPAAGDRVPTSDTPNLHEAPLKSLGELQDAHGPGGCEQMKRDSRGHTEPR